MNHYYTLAKTIRNAARSRMMNNREAMNSLRNVYNNAERNFYMNIPQNAARRNANANKLQAIMRWSQGYWNYSSN